MPPKKPNSITERPAAPPAPEPAPDQTIPLSVSQWYSSEARVSRLREMVADPAHKVAVATLIAAAMPTTAGLRDPETNAARYNWLAGYMDALRDLERMAHIPVQRSHESALPAEWEHLA